MLRTSIIIATAAILFLPLAQAQHSDSYSFGSQHNPYPATVKSGCETVREDRQIAGSLLGAVAGGIVGVALANDHDDDDYHQGYRGDRGYRRHRGYRHHDNDSDEIAGAVIGGVLGAAIGAGIAGSTTDCATVSNYTYDPAYAPTRSAYGPSWQPADQTTTSTELYGSPAESDQTYEQQCTTVQRETRLPDGGFVREAVEVCRDQNGHWVITD